MKKKTEDSGSGGKKRERGKDRMRNCIKSGLKGLKIASFWVFSSNNLPSGGAGLMKHKDKTQIQLTRT